MPFSNKVPVKGSKTDKDRALTQSLLDNLKDNKKLPKVDKNALKNFKAFYVH